MPCQTHGCKARQRLVKVGDSSYCENCARKLRDAQRDGDVIRDMRRQEFLRASGGGDDDIVFEDGDGDDARGATAGPKLVQNELLSYVFTYIDCSSPDMLIDTVEKFYSEDEIRLAKDLLWSEYEGVLPSKASRRRGSVRSAVKATVQDIVLEGAQKIRNSGDMHNVVFCAVDIKKLPKFNPEEMNLQSMVNRLATLEFQMREAQSDIGSNTARITVLENVPDAQTRASNDMRSFASVTQASPPAAPAGDAAPGGAPGGSQAHVSHIPASGATSGSAPPPRHHQNAPPSGQHRGANPAQTQNQGEWIKQRSERKRVIREAVKASKVIVGTRASANLQCGHDVRNVVVANVNKKYTDVDIKEYMKSYGKE